jgi:hypothetical protein
LSLSTMYVENFATWILRQEGKVTWDLYSYNFDADVQLFFERLNTPWINLRQGVDYERLPAILREYGVGVILYKGHIPNYVLNAPNKLFEYLACGLSVWLPSVMKGSLPYCTEVTYPEVVALDFESPDGFHLDRFLRPTEKDSKPSEYFSEIALTTLLNKLLESNLKYDR